MFLIIRVVLLSLPLITSSILNSFDGSGELGEPPLPRELPSLFVRWGLLCIVLLGVVCAEKLAVFLGGELAIGKPIEYSLNKNGSDADGWRE